MKKILSLVVVATGVIAYGVMKNIKKGENKIVEDSNIGSGEKELIFDDSINNELEDIKVYSSSQSCTRGNDSVSDNFSDLNVVDESIDLNKIFEDCEVTSILNCEEINNDDISISTDEFISNLENDLDEILDELNEIDDSDNSKLILKELEDDELNDIINNQMNEHCQEENKITNELDKLWDTKCETFDLKEKELEVEKELKNDNDLKFSYDTIIADESEELNLFKQNDEILNDFGNIKNIEFEESDELLIASKDLGSDEEDIDYSNDVEQLTDDIEKTINKIRENVENTLSKNEDSENLLSKFSGKSMAKNFSDIIAQQKVDGFDEINNYGIQFPYLSHNFIEDTLKFSEKFKSEYVLGSKVSMEHNISFADDDNLYAGIQIFKSLGYKAYETDVERIITLSTVIAVDYNSILKDVFKVSNNVYSLNGEYLKFRIIKK